jgi:hypothetical protein
MYGTNLLHQFHRGSFLASSTPPCFPRYLILLPFQVGIRVRPGGSSNQVWMVGGFKSLIFCVSRTQIYTGTNCRLTIDALKRMKTKLAFWVWWWVGHWRRVAGNWVTYLVGVLRQGLPGVWKCRSYPPHRPKQQIEESWSGSAWWKLSRVPERTHAIVSSHKLRG